MSRIADHRDRFELLKGSTETTNRKKRMQLFYPKRRNVSRIFLSIPLLLTTSSTAVAFSPLCAQHLSPRIYNLCYTSPRIFSSGPATTPQRQNLARSLSTSMALPHPLKVDPTTGTLDSKIPLKVDSSRMSDLSALPKDVTPVVLVACGSFSPPTVLHTRIFESARDYFLSMRGKHRSQTASSSSTHVPTSRPQINALGVRRLFFAVPEHVVMS